METRIGKITHYYDHINVAVLSLIGKLSVGDKVHIHGHTTDLVQEVTSMEIEHKKVSSVGPGDEVALKVNEPVREGYIVFKVTDEKS